MPHCLRILLVTLACSCLAACGGGGGGGGGGGESGSRPATGPLNAGNGPAVSSINSVTPVGAQTFTGLSPNEGGGFYITKNADGLELSTTSSASNRSVSMSASGNDFHDSGDYITSVKETEGRTSMNVGSFQAKDTVLLGGLKLGLQHSEFGIWEADVHYAFEDGSTLSASRAALPFYMGTPGKEAAFASGTGTSTFTGTTVASLNGQTIMAGTASLNVNLASLNASNAQLNFSNFYNFTIPVAVNGAGAIAQGFGPITSVDTGNTTGIDMSTPKIDSASSSFKGQFYGSAANNPQEAVGRYQIYTNDQAWKVLNGSFGVKQ